MAHASKKKNTQVESLKKKMIERGATPRRHTVKRAGRPKERKEHDEGTQNLNDRTGKVDTRSENPEKRNEQ